MLCHSDGKKPRLVDRVTPWDNIYIIRGGCMHLRTIKTAVLTCAALMVLPALSSVADAGNKNRSTSKAKRSHRSRPATRRPVRRADDEGSVGFEQ